MPQNSSFDTNRTALLIMDVQTGIIDNFPHDTAAFFSRLQQVAAAARSAGVQVIYVIVSFRPGHPEISLYNQNFARVKNGGLFVDQQVHSAIAPQGNEAVVQKRRVSAFTGSDLEVILRAGDIKHLILTGIATSGVVLSTLRQAADADYRLTVVSDCCLDRDPEVHAVLTGKVFPSQATVVTAESLIATFASLSAA